MTGNPEDTDRTRVDGRAAEPGAPDRRSGPVVELALVAAALGLLIYLIGFVDDTASGASLTLALLLGGGLLAGAARLPTAGTRVLVPAAVLTATGALLLLRAVAAGSDSALAVGALVLALLEAGAVVGAALLHAGVVRAPRPRPKKQPAAPPHQGFPPQQPGYPAFPGQQYPGQPYPGSYPGHPGEPYPADQYAGEHAFAQNARFGGQYGVPGYPPPPPHVAPGYDPTAPGGPARADVPGSPADDRPTTVAFRSGVPVAPSDAPPGAEAPGAAPTVHGADVFRASRTEGLGGPPAPAGSHAAAGPTATGGFVATGGPSATGSHARPEPAAEQPDADGADDRTRAIPRVTDQG